MHLKQPKLTYSACGLFTKNKERIQKFKETRRDSIYLHIYIYVYIFIYIYIKIYIYIYTERDKNELDTACFQHNMVYGDFKDLARGKASHKALHDRACNIAKNPK